MSYYTPIGPVSRAFRDVFPERYARQPEPYEGWAYLANKIDIRLGACMSTACGFRAESERQDAIRYLLGCIRANDGEAGVARLVAAVEAHGGFPGAVDGGAQ